MSIHARTSRPETHLHHSHASYPIPRIAVALGLTPQVLPKGQLVPKDDQDRVLDGIITPDGVIRGGANQTSEDL